MLKSLTSGYISTNYSLTMRSMLKRHKQVTCICTFATGKHHQSSKNGEKETQLKPIDK